MRKTIKQSLTFLLSLVFLLALLPAGASAADVIDRGKRGDLTWTLDSDGTLTISGTGQMPYINGPEDQPWADYWETIIRVVIESGVTSISGYAFQFCTSMTSVTIPDGVTSIGYGAFNCCEALTSVSIPEGVAYIDVGVFCACTSLESITIPESITEIWHIAFYNCRSLTDVYYQGSESQWQAITVHEDNEPLLNAAIHYNSLTPGSGGEEAPAPPANAPVVQVSTQKLAVDGVEKAIEHYNIDGSNYFKLRDLACLLLGTVSAFDVGYDPVTRTVTVSTGEVYTPLPTDLQEGTDQSASAMVSSQSLVIDGQSVNLTAYNIGGSNYFMLRDLAPYLNFGVDYDAETRTALIVTE